MKKPVDRRKAAQGVDPLRLAHALRYIIRTHDAQAAEMVPGFTCGCTICNVAKDALDQSGANVLSLD
jgi:hypothetical protein